MTASVANVPTVTRKLVFMIAFPSFANGILGISILAGIRARQSIMPRFPPTRQYAHSEPPRKDGAMAGGRLQNPRPIKRFAWAGSVDSAQPWNIDPVMVDGRILKRGGKLAAIDAGMLMAEASKGAAKCATAPSGGDCSLSPFAGSFDKAQEGRGASPQAQITQFPESREINREVLKILPACGFMGSFVSQSRSGANSLWPIPCSSENSEFFC